MKQVFNFLYKYVNKLSADMVLHAYISTIIFLIANLFMNIGFACLVTIGIGIFKEYVIDLYIRKTKAELKDIISDIVGIVIGVIISIMK